MNGIPFPLIHWNVNKIDSTSKIDRNFTGTPATATHHNKKKTKTHINNLRVLPKSLNPRNNL